MSTKSPAVPKWLSAEQLAALRLDPLAVDQEPVNQPRTVTAATGGTREQRRSRAKRAVRSRTISMKRLTKRELELGRLLYPDTGERRPLTRAECEGAERPCPWVSCPYHLYLDVSPRTGAIKLNFPDLEPWELKETCALDVADREGTTLESVAEIMNLTRERVRQIEVMGMARLKQSSDARLAHEMLDEQNVGRPPTGLVAAQELWAPGKIVRLHGKPRQKRRLPVLQPRIDPDFDIIDDASDGDGGDT